MRPPPDLEYLQAYLDGSLPSEQAAALEMRLRREPGLADALVRLARDEAVLAEWARSAAALHIPDAADVPVAIPFEHPGPSASKPLYRRPRFVATLTAAAAAVLLVVILGRGFFHRTPAPVTTTDVARLEEVQGEVFVVPEAGEPFPARSGQDLKAGQGVTTRGEGSFAILAASSAWRLEVGADTTIHLPSQAKGKNVVLEQGIVAADVGPQPYDRPMIVTTPHAEARLLGGKSSFSSTLAETRIEPEKGKVHLVRKSDGRAIDVNSGQYAVAAAATDLFTAKPVVAPVVTQPRTVLTELAGQALCAAFSPDGATLAIGCTDGSIKLWDLVGATVRLTLPGKRNVRALAYAPGGKLLAAGYDDRTVRVWDTAGWTEVTTLKDFRASVGALAFAPDAAVLAAAGSPGKGGADLRVWETKTWKEVALPKDQLAGVGTLAFAPKGHALATAGKDNTIKVWDTTLWQVRQTLTGHVGRINTVAFTPEGLLVSGGKERVVKVWDVATGTEQRSLQSQGCEVRSLAFTPDGKLGVAADQNVTLWDVGTGQERLTFKGQKHAVGTALFQPGGKLLATVGGDKTVRFWDTTLP